MIDRILTLPERRTGVLIVTIGVLFAAAYGASLVLRPKADGRVIVGDALHHYVQLRSAVFDGDLHFRNEYVRMYRLQGGEPGSEWIYEATPTGHVRNLMPVGPAILWSPLFLVTAGFTWLANLLGNHAPQDGYSRVAQASAGLSGVAAATAGVWLSWRACSLMCSARAAAWSALSLWLASSAIYYSLVSPAYSHAASLLGTSAFWYAWVRTRGRCDTGRYAMLGVLAGAAALMRWQDAVLLVPIGIDLLRAAAAGHVRHARAVALGAGAVAGAALAFTPQMAVWMILYGQPFALPQGEGFMRWAEPALGSVLFSDFHGLFTWTPIVAVAVAGLVPFWRTNRDVALGAGLFLLLSWYVNAAVADWWAGEAFGARRFISCFTPFAFGLAALIDRWGAPLRAVALVGTLFVVHAGLLLVQYQAFMHGLRDLVPYPRGIYGLWLARFTVPLDLAREWLSR